MPPNMGNVLKLVKSSKICTTVEYDMTKCPICGAEDFDENDGLYFCADCGTQSQDIREEIADDAADQTLSQSRLMRVKTQKKKAEEEEKVSWNYYEIFQLILQAQADSLIKLGFKPVVKDCIRTIWFHFLGNFGMGKLKPKTAQSNGEPSAKKRKTEDDLKKEKQPRVISLEFDPTEELNFDITSESSNISSEEETEEDISIPGVFTRSATNTKERTSVSYLTLMSCVAMCYLGLLYAGETVLLVDVARWMRMNHIPYYQLRTSVLRDHITMTTTDRRTFSPVHTVRPDRIYLHARKLYQALSLPQLPVVDVLAVGKKLLNRLLLPASFQGCLHKLLLIHKIDPHHGLSSRYLKGSERSEVECMAAIVVLLKMFYRLDDQYEVHQSCYVQGEHCSTSQEHGMFVWSDWVRLFSENHNQKDIAGLLLTPEELLRTKDLKEYLEFCKTQVFGCNRKETKYSTFNKDTTQELEQIFTNFLNKTSPSVSVTQSSSQPYLSSASITGEQDISIATECKFKPRIIPLNFSVPGFGRAYSSYCFHPVRFDFQELPRSYQFVLSVCSSLVETDTKSLFNRVKCIESQLNKQLRFIRNLQREYGQENVTGQQP